MAVQSSEHLRLSKLFDLLYHDLESHPAATRIIAGLVNSLIGRLHRFSLADGYAPDSLAELELVIAELFGNNLQTLRATSIHSDRERLTAYKGYWEDPELGPYFKTKNDQFLRRATLPSRLMRIFACDSLADAVAEQWFRETALGQVALGGEVKIVQIERGEAGSYEDFGIYEHKAATTDESDFYLLLAPSDPKSQQRGLSTTISVHAATIEDYRHKFDKLWQRSRILKKEDSANLRAATKLKEENDGLGNVRDLFDGRIILRRMMRLDTRERLLPGNSPLARKYQMSYARALSSHIRRRFADVRRIVYVGDTHKNDGGVIRNLQAIEERPVTGFVCEPKLEIGRVWFNDVLYTNQWTDLIALSDVVGESAGGEVLGIFDIDQTIWAPKGIHEGPLVNSRIVAIESLLDEYVDAESNELRVRTRERVRSIYEELSAARYLSLTLDNEDYKAVVCVALALNLVFDEYRLEVTNRELSAGYFAELGLLDERLIIDFMRGKYFTDFCRLNSGEFSEINIDRFIRHAWSTAHMKQYVSYSEAHGINLDRLQSDLEQVFRETAGMSSIQYVPFRERELAAVLASVHTSIFANQLVINRPVWDFAVWLKRAGASLLALSDRPEESTIAPSGESLLDANIAIYGKHIGSFLGRQGEGDGL
jgi:hypothetical protein